MDIENLWVREMAEPPVVQSCTRQISKTATELNAFPAVSGIPPTVTSCAAERNVLRGKPHRVKRFERRCFLRKRPLHGVGCGPTIDRCGETHFRTLHEDFGPEATMRWHCRN